MMEEEGREEEEEEEAGPTERSEYSRMDRWEALCTVRRLMGMPLLKIEGM